MISTHDSAYKVTDQVFFSCVNIIHRAGIGAIIAEAHRKHHGSGGRRPQCRFTWDAVLAVALCIIHVGRVPSMAEIYRLMRTLTPEQLAEVGMDARELAAQQPGPGYHALITWIHRQCVVIDPGADLPARRVSNLQHRQMVAGRTEEAREASEVAQQTLDRAINAIVAASVEEKVPAGYHGDVVADETIIDLAGPSSGLGARDEKNRGAAYMGRYYVRDDRGVPQTTALPVYIRKSGFGVGLTAVTRVGPPGAVESVPPVITGIAIHPPTSGSVEGLCSALDAHNKSGFSGCRSPRARWPFLVVDMGYKSKRAFARAMLARQLSPVVRYPRHWKTLYGTSGGSDTKSRLVPGPVQIAGVFYCPAAASIIEDKRVVRRTTELLETDEFRAHDQLIRRLFPLLMGTNGRPNLGVTTSGRPRHVKTQFPPVRQALVCPAVQRRVRCPLKPESMILPPKGAPTVEPPAGADRFQCCRNSQVTVTFSEEQIRMMQPGLVPGSWEHALYYEAARSLTEQRFSIMKSEHCTGFESLKWAPRRQPMISIILALQVAETNRVIQRRWNSRRKGYTGSTARRWEQLRADLGHAPMLTPPRT